MDAGPAEAYLKDNVKSAYRIFKMFLYLNNDEVPTREDPEMEEQLYQLLSDKDALLHSKLIKHILNSFWAFDLMDVEVLQHGSSSHVFQDAEGLRDLLGASPDLSRLKGWDYIPSINPGTDQ